MDQQTQHDIQHAVAELTARRPSYMRARRYYNGDHDLVFAGQKFKTTFGDRFHAFADNLCAPVVDAVADRLRVTGWRGSDTAQAAALDLWQRSRMPRQAGEVHLEAVRAGDAYLLVWPDATGMPRMYAHSAATCAVAYDPELPGVARYALKVWADGKTARVNIYYPDRVERYGCETADGSLPSDVRKLQLWEADGPAVVANPWQQVPVFHFASNAELGAPGRSELAAVVPLQDALNKLNADMLVTAETVAMPLRYLVGVELPVDPQTGRTIAPKGAPGALWSFGEGAEVGQLPQADLTPLLNAAAAYRREIAVVSRTPLHLLGLGGDQYPSGEALKTAERPLVDKVLDRQLAFGDVWADAMELALRMAGVVERVETVWAPAATVSEAEELANAVLKEQVGYSRRQVLLDLGVPETQVDDMLAEADAQTAALGDQLLSAFNSGNP